MPDWKILHGDCLVRLKELEDESVDAVVCDPPYGLEFMGSQWDGADGFRRSLNAADVGRDNVFGRTSRTSPEYRAGHLFQEFCESWARECLRILKPGGHLLACGGTRTYHRMVCGVEDAGFEIRDCVMWIHSQGMPKSRNIAKAIDRAAGVERPVVGINTNGSGPNNVKLANHGKGDTGIGYMDGSGKVFEVTASATEEAKKWDGWGSNLKPAVEPIVVCRKPLVGTLVENVLKYGTGGINIDACRVEGEPVPINRLEKWSGFGQEKSPDYQQEINTLGRWPANVCTDGSDEVLAVFPDAPGQQGFVGEHNGDRDSVNCYGDWGPRPDTHPRGDAGSAARFEKTCRDGELSAERTYEDSGATNFAMKPGQRRFDGGSAARVYYTAKVSPSERNAGGIENSHPTLKPISLMSWLIKLVTPPGGTVCDPFAGSGSGGCAAILEGFNYIGIEREEPYVRIAEARLKWAVEERLRATAQQELFPV